MTDRFRLLLSGPTQATSFGSVPAINAELYSVNEGVEAFYAVLEAQCLEAAVRELLEDAAMGDFSPDVANLCEFAMHAAKALRQAAGVSV